MQLPSGLLVTCWAWVVLVTSGYDAVMAGCPWKEAGLLPWSSPSTWDDNLVPGPRAKVVITKRVLLDVQPPTLGTITIQPGGALVWGNINNLLLNVSFIRVLGEFHIGAENCRFKKKATINLYGRFDSPLKDTTFGRKFIGIDGGGQLELHGLEKTSWTHLAHTIPAASTFTCSNLFEYKLSHLSKEARQGLHVLLWDTDGSVMDYAVFTENDWAALPAFLQAVPDGTVVAAAVDRYVGKTTEVVFSTFESLGATLIRGVINDKAYSFVAKKGDKTTAKEEFLTNGYASMVDRASGLEFRSASLAKTVDFQVLDDEVTNPKITVSHDVSSWSIGDQVVITSTDFDWRQAEVKTMVDCSDCLPNQIRLDSPFQYMHYGEITMNIDERAEVALLTRNILIQGQLDDHCHVTNTHDKWLCEIFGRDMFGGHIRAREGSVMHVEGVELFHMGQQHELGSYPLHFHMMNNASGMWVRNNSIHHALSRCVTIHATFHAEVSDNVCYIHAGHGYFLEDGVEQFNILDRNLGVGTIHGALTLGDRNRQWCPNMVKYCEGISTFWITHPNNIVTRNVAAGSDVHGFMYVFSDIPLGKSRHSPWIRERVANYSVQYHPILQFSHNVAHSNFKAGVFFDSRLSSGEMDGDVFVPENGVLPVTPNYDPRHPPNASGRSVWTEMDGLTMYKNRLQNSWIKGGNIRVVNSSFADSQESFTGGTIGFISGTEVAHSIFVGITDNPGHPSLYIDPDLVGNPSVVLNYSYGRNPFDSWTGVSFYQGPMMVTNCHFSRYGHSWWADHWLPSYGFRPVRPGAALSFKRDNIYPSTPYSFVKGLKFAECDDVDDENWVFRGNGTTFGWGDRDGNKANTFHDVDGSVTGHPLTQLVIARPFYMGPHCVHRPSWHLAACPYKYVQMEVYGNDGVLSKTNRASSPLIIQRDDVPDDIVDIAGLQKNTYLLRTHLSYTVSFNPELAEVPTFFDIRGFGMEKGDVVRVALCLPNDTTQFMIRSLYPIIDAFHPPVMASSLTELENDVTGRVFYWDSVEGLLYFKLQSNETRQNVTESCANGQCVRYKINRLDGSNTPVSCRIVPTRVLTDNNNYETPPSAQRCSESGSTEGLGATPADVVIADPFTITCPSLQTPEDRRTPEYRGCYREKGIYRDVPHAVASLTKAMTQDWCQQRCYNRNYTYAALTVGMRCFCGDVFGLYDVLTDDKCSAPCRGDRNTTCGGVSKIEVYTTGLVPKPTPAPCGPQNLGEVVGGACLYLRNLQVTAGQSHRQCARLGGQLVTIYSQEKQTAIERYLRDKKMKGRVWTGLNHVRDSSQWVYRDGTPLGPFSFWKGDGGSDRLKHFVYMSGLDGYKWVQTKDSLSALAATLCDLPLSPIPPAEACGMGNKGLRLGASGTCYMIMNDLMSQVQASYTCYLTGGQLVDYVDVDSEMELGEVLFRFGEQQNYWLGRLNRVLQWSNSMYLSTKVARSALAGAFCELDTVNEVNSCPEGWGKYQDSCYLYVGTQIQSFSEGVALCEMGEGKGHVLRIESQEENTYVTSVVTSAYDTTTSTVLLLDLSYSSRRDSFLWGDGEVPGYTAWRSENGIHNLVNGSCAVMDTTSTSGEWANAPCSTMLVNLICEMPAFVDTTY